MSAALSTMVRLAARRPDLDLFGAAPGDDATETIHVIAADPLAQHSLCLVLEANGLRTRAYASAGDFLAETGPSALGCVLANLGDPPTEALTLIGELAARGARLPVIVVTGSGNVSWAVAAMKAGAADLIQAPLDEDVLLRAVFRTLHAPRKDAAQRPARADVDSRFARLSARESQVFERVAKGASNKMIARELGISPRTVETYRASLMAKLHVSGVAELVRVWLEHAAANPASRPGAAAGGFRPSSDMTERQ